MLEVGKAISLVASCVSRQRAPWPLRKIGPVNLQETAEELHSLHNGV